MLFTMNQVCLLREFRLFKYILAVLLRVYLPELCGCTFSAVTLHIVAEIWAQQRSTCLYVALRRQLYLPLVFLVEYSPHLLFIPFGPFFDL